MSKYITEINSPTYGTKTIIVDNEDKHFLEEHNWFLHKEGNIFYMTANIGRGKALRLHRLILNAPKDKIVDHIDGDGLNNSKSNLRLCNKTQNGYNRNKNKNNTSGYKGVSKNGSRYRATIYQGSKRIHLGYFNTAEEASEAYLIAAKEIQGDFAKTR